MPTYEEGPLTAAEVRSALQWAIGNLQTQIARLDDVIGAFQDEREEVAAELAQLQGILHHQRSPFRCRLIGQLNRT